MQAQIAAGAMRTASLLIACIWATSCLALDFSMLSLRKTETRTVHLVFSNHLVREYVPNLHGAAVCGLSSYA